MSKKNKPYKLAQLAQKIHQRNIHDDIRPELMKKGETREAFKARVQRGRAQQ